MTKFASAKPIVSNGPAHVRGDETVGPRHSVEARPAELPDRGVRAVGADRPIGGDPPLPASGREYSRDGILCLLDATSGLPSITSALGSRRQVLEEYFGDLVLTEADRVEKTNDVLDCIVVDRDRLYRLPDDEVELGREQAALFDVLPDAQASKPSSVGKRRISALGAVPISSSRSTTVTRMPCFARPSAVARPVGPARRR
ncbi:hypothetical protein A5724_26535 [Mycobacterium sp. ACS1612]|nr:hypothetical protein [Mycobacterium sp. ACS1612]OBF28958.1 hypothetical protein A5724_26535 [Mycobacterium sp. ACS1612]